MSEPEMNEDKPKARRPPPEPRPLPPPLRGADIGNPVRTFWLIFTAMTITVVTGFVTFHILRG